MIWHGESYLHLLADPSIYVQNQMENSPRWLAAVKWLSLLQNSLREVLADKWKIPLDQSNALHSICWACVCVVECACARMRSWVLFTLGKLSHAIWSRALREPPQPHPPNPSPTHPPLNTESYWRKHVVTSLRHAGVSVCGSGGPWRFVDTLLPYVCPACSPSAGLISTDFLQWFLMG